MASLCSVPEGWYHRYLMHKTSETWSWHSSCGSQASVDCFLSGRAGTSTVKWIKSRTVWSIWTGRLPERILQWNWSEVSCCSPRGNIITRLTGFVVLSLLITKGFTDILGCQHQPQIAFWPDRTNDIVISVEPWITSHSFDWSLYNSKSNYTQSHTASFQRCWQWK